MLPISTAVLNTLTLKTKLLLLNSALGYDGGAVLVQGAYGEPATDSYKVKQVFHSPLKEKITGSTCCWYS